MSTSNVYPGSCHCGAVQYQVRLKLPPVHDPRAESVRIYKCNCSTCHKTGIFHCRPISPGDDFILTSPSPSELGDYRCFEKRIGWYFCKTCGVRTFGAGGVWNETDLDVAKWATGEENKSSGETQKVWTISKGEDFTRIEDGKKIVKPLHYLSVNAFTLEVGEGGVDLRDWHEKGWIFYVENAKRLNGTQMRLEKPFDGGLY